MIIEAYAYERHRSLLDAFTHVVLRMQPTTRELAYHAIANPRLCAFEPGGSSHRCR